MPEFTTDATRVDPYKNFKFRVKWDGTYVAGISKVSSLTPPPRSSSRVRAVTQARAATHPAGPNTRRSRLSGA
jgi:hypothetical protein